MTLSTPNENFFDYYRDTGCKESKSCLSCPLPQCVHDGPLARRESEHRYDAERANAVEIAAQTMSRSRAVTEVARAYGVTKRTILRILKRTDV